MRLSTPGILARADRITLRFDGVPVPAIAGESIAAALSAAGVLAFRSTASGAPRGLWCGMGACFDCIVTVDGRAGQRACMVKAKDGMCVDSALRPQAALATAAPDVAEIACDVLVVGAGPAGLTAAIAARRAGADVLVLDERDAVGGQYFKPLADSHAAASPDAQFRAGNVLRAEAEDAGVVIAKGATAWGACCMA